MKTNEPRMLNMELNRTVARNATTRSVNAGSVHRLTWLGIRRAAPGFFRVKAPLKPELDSEAPASQGARPIGGETASMLTLYCREIGRVKLLSSEEEAALARRVQEGDEAAREEMIKANLRLVVKIARDYEGMGLALLDLISEGNLGLMKAVDRYDLARGAKLSVYAAYWIKNYIRRALSNHARTIRVPVYLQGQRPAVYCACLRLQELLGRDPTNEEIAQEAGLSAERVRKMREATQSTISLDQALEERDGRTVAETVADEQVKAPDEALAHATALQQLWHFLGELDTREQTILRARFGLDGGEEGSLVMIGQQLKLSRERVRQIERDALAKLRRKLKKKEGPPQAS